MILRLVRAGVLPGHLDALRDGLAEAFYPRARATEGLVRSHVGIRAVDVGHEVIFVTIWASAEAELSALGGDVSRIGQLASVSEHLDVSAVEHYEVDESSVQASDALPVVLRAAAGWIEMGPDIEIQQELRRRMRELGPELIEAYVGRRMRGKTVEVAFVTLWSDAPRDQSLDEPIWPDIAARYRSFYVDTYEPVVDPG